MSLQDASAWFGILGGALAVPTTMYVAIDSYRKGRKKRLDVAAVVTTNAIQLMEQLDTQLDAANRRADDLAGKLSAANERADALKHQHDEMASRLADAQAEVRVLRGQVKMLTAELDRHGGRPEGKP